jgi:hypothetical protein
MTTSNVPYGIDQRPTPHGATINQLAPPQVGPYNRIDLRSATSKSLNPNVPAAPDDAMYVDYRAGDAKIFVELGVMHSVNDARESLDVAAGDAAGGVFPTDPRFGARGQEPSYFKVVDGSGAFFAWTRENYYFSAHAERGEADLDAFMESFPY